MSHLDTFLKLINSVFSDCVNGHKLFNFVTHSANLVLHLGMLHVYSHQLVVHVPTCVY
jgi:hypothetical protein